MEENMNIETVETEQGQETEIKTYTQEEVNDLLQREVDRRITSALKKQAEKFNKEKAEYEKLRDMDEKQRAEYEFNKRVEEFELKEKEFNLIQNKLSASKVLAERGLPVGFVDYIVAEDADTMMDNITTFEREWKAAINDAITTRLASSGKPGSKANTQTGLTKEEFKKMSISQQAELYRTNPELYKQMIG
jgi:hypothetical protein